MNNASRGYYQLVIEGPSRRTSPHWGAGRTTHCGEHYGMQCGKKGKTEKAQQKEKLILSFVFGLCLEEEKRRTVHGRSVRSTDANSLEHTLWGSAGWIETADNQRNARHTWQRQKRRIIQTAV
ncbi:hypothetical protein Ddc_01760 [Ditylenchus destructor]|nr:hypothetical protein Ddc_01760 [Ditylenchus destructor]